MYSIGGVVCTTSAQAFLFGAAKKQAKKCENSFSTAYAIIASRGQRELFLHTCQLRGDGTVLKEFQGESGAITSKSPMTGYTERKVLVLFNARLYTDFGRDSGRETRRS